MKSKELFEELLNLADIKINGSRDWDIQIHNPKVYSRVLSGGSMALGQSYMDGWWDVKKLDEFINKLLIAKLDKKIKTLKGASRIIKSKILNMQNEKRARIVGKHHYDLGNELYKGMLDKGMNYSCAYWKKARNLEDAQNKKLDLICKKLKLKKGMKVLDIGCGWGGFAYYAAKKYGVKVVGVTISKQQALFAKKRCEKFDIDIRLQDYRKVKEVFDRIVSIGMFEHVGKKNYKTFFEIANKCLKKDGLFLLHTIGRKKSGGGNDPWIEKYIFPNGMLPSIKQIAKSTEELFIIEDLHNFGPDYDKTLMAWNENFVKHSKKMNYENKFYRMWTYYLLSCAGSFRARKNQLWQIVFSKGVTHYESIR